MKKITPAKLYNTFSILFNRLIQDIFLQKYGFHRVGVYVAAFFWEDIKFSWLELQGCQKLRERKKECPTDTNK